MVTWHWPLPKQPPPDQPLNTEPAEALAVNVTCEPARNKPEQDDPQSIREGTLLTVPDPFPNLETVRVCSALPEAPPEWQAELALGLVPSIIPTPQSPSISEPTLHRAAPFDSNAIS